MPICLPNRLLESLACCASTSAAASFADEQWSVALQDYTLGVPFGIVVAMSGLVGLAFGVRRRVMQ